MVNLARPFIQLETVSDALEAMRQAKPLGAKHPLAHFLSLRGFSADREENAAADAAIFRKLSSLISRRLIRYRERHGVRLSADEGGMLKADFKVGSKELEAWSVLYYRYVRVDLDLSVEKIEEMANQSERTLRRRQYAGVVRLAHTLAEREVRARTRQKRAWMRAGLPRLRPPQLVGRDTEVDDVFRRIAEGPRTILLHGAPGIGKSDVALAMAHRAIEALDIANLAWIEHADPEPNCLLEAVALRLGVSPTELPVYLQMADVLIVVDHVDEAASRTEFEQALNTLAPARVILCARESMAQRHGMERVLIPPLDQEAAFTLLEREAARRQIDDLELLGRMHRDLGGNPGALLMALKMGRRYRPTRISAHLYQTLWDSASEEERLTWLVMTLYRDIPSEAAIAQNVETLERRGIFAETGELARAFARRVMASGEHRELVRTAFQQAIALFATYQPGIVEHLELLQMARLAVLPALLHLNIAYEFGPMIERAGAWAAWATYLELVHDMVRSQPREDATHGWWARTRLGVALRWLARRDEARYHLSEVVKETGEAGQFDLQTEALLELAVLEQQRGEYQIAERYLMRSINYLKRHKRSYERALALCIQGALDQNALATAEKYLNEAFTTVSGGEGTAGSGVSPQLLALAAQFALRQNKTFEALDYAEQAWQGLEGDAPRLARLAILIGQIHYRRREVTEAVNSMTLGIESMARTGDLLGNARARLNLGLMYIGWGKMRAAGRCLRELPAEFEKLGDITSLQTTLDNLRVIRQALDKGGEP